MAFDLDEEELKTTRKMNKADRNEIEVGEYIRTKDGIIDKVDSLCGMIENTVYLKQQSLWFNADYIVKHSKQLIDIIEVGDYVNNGYRVINVINEGPCPSGKCIDIDSSKDSSECTLWEEDIKTILTKEQFDVNCYEVGGEDESTR